MRLKVSPTPSNTPSNTPSYTPTGTACPGLTPTPIPCVCFSSITYSYSGVPSTQPILIIEYCNGRAPAVIISTGGGSGSGSRTTDCTLNGGFTSYSASTYITSVSLNGCCGPDITNTPTQTQTSTQTPTQTQTSTQGLSPTPTPTPTNTQTSTPTMTPTQTQTSTQGLTPTTTPTNTQTPSPSSNVTCIQVIDTVIEPIPQSGTNNFFGVNIALSPYPVTENVTVTGYIREVGDPSNRYDFSITIIGGTQSGETANNVLMTGPADNATIVVTGVTPTTATYNGNSVYICGYEPEPTPTQTPTQTQTPTPTSTTPECECFSALTYSYSGVPSLQPIIIAYYCDGSEPLTIVANGSYAFNMATTNCNANGGFTSYSASTYAYNISLSGCCGPDVTNTPTPSTTEALTPTPTSTPTPTPSATSTLIDLSLIVEQRTGDPDFTEIWVTVGSGITFSQNLSFDWTVDVSPAGSSSGTATITTGQNEVYLTGFDPNFETFVNASLSNVTPNPIDGYNILV